MYTYLRHINGCCLLSCSAWSSPAVPRTRRCCPSIVLPGYPGPPRAWWSGCALHAHACDVELLQSAVRPLIGGKDSLEAEVWTRVCPIHPSIHRIAFDHHVYLHFPSSRRARQGRQGRKGGSRVCPPAGRWRGSVAPTHHVLRGDQPRADEIGRCHSEGGPCVHLPPHYLPSRAGTWGGLLVPRRGTGWK